MNGRILQLNTSIPLKCGAGCLFIKLKLGRVGMGRVLGRVGMSRVLSGPSWHGPSWFWAELSCTRVGFGGTVGGGGSFFSPKFNQILCVCVLT